MRDHMLQNELAILTGTLRPSATPARRLEGPSLVTMEAVRNLVQVAGCEFGSVFAGCELLIPDENMRQRTSAVHYIATIVGSRWRHPEWVAPHAQL